MVEKSISISFPMQNFTLYIINLFVKLNVGENVVKEHRNCQYNYVAQFFFIVRIHRMRNVSRKMRRIRELLTAANFAYVHNSLHFRCDERKRKVWKNSTVYVFGRTNVALTEIKIEESDSQLIPKVPRKFLARWNFRCNT